MLCSPTRSIFFSCFISIFLFNFLYSQEAEKLYKDNSKLGFFLQPSLAHGFMGRNTEPTLKFNNTFSYQAGAVYNFAQSGNFNFKAGVAIKTLHSNFDVLYVSPTTGYDYSQDWFDVDLSTDLVISEMLKLEYMVPISSSFNIVGGFGVSLDLRITESQDSLGLIDYNQDSGSQTILMIDSQSKQITSSVDFSVGSNYKTKYGLVQIDAFLNMQLTTYPKDGTYTFYDKGEVVSGGAYTLKSNYYGLTLTFCPKKRNNKEKIE